MLVSVCAIVAVISVCYIGVRQHRCVLATVYVNVGVHKRCVRKCYLRKRLIINLHNTVYQFLFLFQNNYFSIF